MFVSALSLLISLMACVILPIWIFCSVRRDYFLLFFGILQIFTLNTTVMAVIRDCGGMDFLSRIGRQPWFSAQYEVVYWIGLISRVCLAAFFVGLMRKPSLKNLEAMTKHREPEESDFGRRFGWFIERDGTRIGELEYLRWDSEGQFWHEYRLSWLNPADAVVGPDAWLASGLVLRNRRYTDVVVSSFLTSREREGGVIAVRGAYVPEERLRPGDT